MERNKGNNKINCRSIHGTDEIKKIIKLIAVPFIRWLKPTAINTDEFKIFSLPFHLWNG